MTSTPADGAIRGRNLPRAWTITGLVVLFVVCWLGIGRDLWTPDEPREAEISREMWIAPTVVPKLNGEVFIEKPPLYYWTVAGVFELTGGASTWAARSVSAIASFLTLLLVFLWGRRELSTGLGLLAAIGLATSTQFMISSHWVLIDPLLMLFSTIAAWAGWELVCRGGGWRAMLAFYGALILALWTKGLIAPILFGCGFVALAAWTRSLKPVWNLRPLVGVAALVLATAAFGWLVYAEAGYEAVKEWFWVNHVMRFIDPQDTGHAQPFYYYLVNIPTAVLPWWVPFADVFRPKRWRDPTVPNRDLRTYLAALCLGMAVILTASTTKRSIYLLPMLPLLALLLAAHAGGWFSRRGALAIRGWPWWTQFGLLTAFAVLPAVVGMGYVGRFDALALAVIIVAVASLGYAIATAGSGNTGRAAGLLALSAVTGVVSLLVVVVNFAAPEKNMSAFVSWVDEQIPAGETIYGYGSLDETFDGIVPFVTGRSVVALTTADISRIAPEHIVVQDKQGGATAPDLGPDYRRLGEQNFGPGRYLAIWQKVAP